MNKHSVFCIIVKKIHAIIFMPAKHYNIATDKKSYEIDTHDMNFDDFYKS